MRLPEPPDVLPGPEPWVDLVVGQRGEAAVARRRERRQDVDPAVEASREVLVEHVREAPQVTAQAVRIRDELDLVLHLHGVRLTLPG